jgi:hypothetical protein
MVPASGWVRVAGWGRFEQVGSVGKSQWEAIVYGGYDVTCHLDSSAAMMTDRDLRRHGPFCACARRIVCGEADGDADQYRRRRYGM